MRVGHSDPPAGVQGGRAPGHVCRVLACLQGEIGGELAASSLAAGCKAQTSSDGLELAPADDGDKQAQAGQAELAAEALEGQGGKGGKEGLWDDEADAGTVTGVRQALLRDWRVWETLKRQERGELAGAGEVLARPPTCLPCPPMPWPARLSQGSRPHLFRFDASVFPSSTPRALCLVQYHGAAPVLCLGAHAAVTCVCVSLPPHLLPGASVLVWRAGGAGSTSVGTASGRQRGSRGRRGRQQG